MVTLRHAADDSAARWISTLSFDELTTFGPPGFEAYARLRYIPDPTTAGQSENDVVGLPDDHLTELDQARRALARLAGYTSTPGDCYYCIWDGYGDLNLAAVPGEPTVLHFPHRRYTLMEGPLDALQTWESGPGMGGPLVPPALIWPADHSWCFVSDVDPHWAGIGASSEAIDQLLGDPAIDVATADPGQRQPYYY
jgi:hypothetical protein